MLNKKYHKKEIPNPLYKLNPSKPRHQCGPSKSLLHVIDLQQTITVICNCLLHNFDWAKSIICLLGR